MATLFNSKFQYIELTQPTYGSDGALITGTVSERTVRGSVQAVSGRDAIAMAIGGRQTGDVKVYSSERLQARAQDGTGIGYVRCGGCLYEITQEIPEQNGLIPHFKYLANLVPVAQIPEALK